MNKPYIHIGSENEVLLTAMLEVIQSATAKKLNSEIYFSSGATLRDTLKIHLHEITSALTNLVNYEQFCIC